MDVRFHNEGSLVGIEPLSDAAKAWIADNVEADGCNWLGKVLYAKPSYAHLIASAMAADGFDFDY